jgi:hypothetical protein
MAVFGWDGTTTSYVEMIGKMRMKRWPWMVFVPFSVKLDNKVKFPYPPLFLGGDEKTRPRLRGRA